MNNDVLLVYDTRNKPIQKRRMTHILSKDILEKIAFLEPGIAFEVRALGFDRRSILYAAKITNHALTTKRLYSYKIGSYRRSKPTVDRLRSFFWNECNEHARRNNLPYKVEFVKEMQERIFLGI